MRSVEEQIDAIGRGDYESAVSHAHPDVEMEVFAPPEFPWIRRARGIAELRNALEHNFSALEQQQPEILNVIAQGDVVVLIGRERGRIRETGAAYDVEFVHRFTFRDRALASVRVIAAKTLPDERAS